ncbi:LADA_0E01244g1_1 [Lachancea dasiensis]|uniref:LADA_0E01244g1_1 n=1 Tax=Lachancea dasiensis TaxID=1072105 RepID=A0A1G4JAD9_9SACH|nr:LADA_0E01244g1_1 [Lachancea dasiensis]
MSKKQEYIAKIRYRNDLPPPLLPPKLLNYRYSPSEAVNSGKLITSLYTKTNVTPLVKLNDDLGMPMDLMELPGLLDHKDTKLLHGFDNIKLHPDDRVLLRDPRVDILTKTDMSKVTFLRRTEYVSSSQTAKPSTKKRVAAEALDVDDEVLEPSQRVKRIENTFDPITDDLSKIKHPSRKNLQAVRTWDLLPDTAAMDQTFFTVRFIGSAALDNKEKEQLAMSTALFRPVELEEDEWVSLYTTDKSSSTAYENNLEQQIDEIVDDDKAYEFKRLRDFDMKHQQPEGTDLFSELALRFNNEKKAIYYTPIRSRIELRRRRINDVIKPLVRENNLDQINIKIRNPTTQETRFRDSIRMKFDPIDFPNIEEEEDEETNQESQNRESNLLEKGDEIQQDGELKSFVPESGLDSEAKQDDSREASTASGTAPVA